MARFNFEYRVTASVNPAVQAYNLYNYNFNVTLIAIISRVNAHIIILPCILVKLRFELNFLFNVCLLFPNSNQLNILHEEGMKILHGSGCTGPPKSS